jgi:HEAT repeat protein
MNEINTLESVNSDIVLDLLDEQPPDEIKGIEPMFDLGAFESNDQVEEIAPVEVPWLEIDLNHTDNGNGSSAIELTQLPAPSKSIEPVAVRPGAIAGLEPVDDSTVSAQIQDLLKSQVSTDRAAALTDLAEVGGEEAFDLITQSFDDPAIEVRNAAARALHDLSHDRAGSFTRALREATPERRRKIGAAIAGSGLAADAINSLSGEGRDRTYDAYSLLFLMAKSGEVSPLMQAISQHSTLDVRLTSIKLLALSNQQQVLSSLRRLAAREALPPEVHSAVMEAIYSISTQAREQAPSLA